MPKDDLVYIGHMLDMFRKIIEKTATLSRDAFDDNEDTRIVVAHLIQVAGEAANRISRKFQRAHPAIPWKQVIAMRHRIVHDYLDIDYDIVWAVATIEIPRIIGPLEKITKGASQNNVE